MDWRGTLAVQAALSTHSGEMQKADFLFKPEVSGTLGDWGNFTVIGQIRGDPVDKLEPGQPAAARDTRARLNQRGFQGEVFDAELREAYLDMFFGERFLRIGKQQVVWGQADGLRVLDAINPLHFREFILGDFEDRRIPLWMVNYEQPLGSAVLQILWIPDHTYNDIPTRGVFAFSSPRFRPSIPDGFSGRIEIADTQKPDRLFKDDDFGARLTGFNGGWDWSLNYLYTYSDNPVFRRRMPENNTVLIEPVFERTHIFGGSASNAFGKITLRLETGWFSDRFVSVEDGDGVASTDEINVVLGADYQLNGDTFLSAQIFQSQLMDRPDEARRETTETTLTLLGRKDFKNDTVQAEALLIYSADDKDGVLQFSLDYDMSDSITLAFGVDLFFGDREGLFGQFDMADRFTLGVSYEF